MTMTAKNDGKTNKISLIKIRKKDKNMTIQTKFHPLWDFFTKTNVTYNTDFQNPCKQRGDRA
ncbi:MAG: hypothetical protein EA361_02345 [Bacteroidetes bacterium]|nr:MAG: hypothetical protein EA361_02345 [Bacteroidota bacterium]